MKEVSPIRYHSLGLSSNVAFDAHQIGQFAVRTVEAGEGTPTKQGIIRGYTHAVDHHPSGINISITYCIEDALLVADDVSRFCAGATTDLVPADVPSLRAYIGPEVLKWINFIYERRIVVGYREFQRGELAKRCSFCMCYGQCIPECDDDHVPWDRIVRIANRYVDEYFGAA